jgi:hypothetical protein
VIEQSRRERERERERKRGRERGREIAPEIRVTSIRQYVEKPEAKMSLWKRGD